MAEVPNVMANFFSSSRLARMSCSLSRTARSNSPSRVLPVGIRIDDFAEIRADNGLHQGRHFLGIIGRQANLHDFGVAGKTHAQPALKPPYGIPRFLRMADRGRPGHLRLAERGQKHEAADEKLPLRGLVDFKAVAGPLQCEVGSDAGDGRRLESNLQIAALAVYCGWAGSARLSSLKGFASLVGFFSWADVMAVVETSQTAGGTSNTSTAAGHQRPRARLGPPIPTRSEHV